MNRLIIRILMISAIVFVLSLFLSRIIYRPLKLTPYSWGSDIIHQKRMYLKKHREDLNTIFIGSSRVFRQINPQVFDSSVNASYGIHSFNFGVNWLFPPESFYIYNRLLEKDSLKLKYAFIELSKIKSIDYSNLHTTRIKYWYNRKDYFFTMNAIAYSNFPLIEKIATLCTHTISYFDKLINLGYLTEAFDFHARFKKKNAGDSFVNSNNGYVSLSDAAGDTEGANNGHLKDTMKVIKRAMMSLQAYKKIERHPELLDHCNSAYLKKIDELIRDSGKKGIYIVFILSPRLDQKQYAEILPLFFNLPAKHRIDMNDSRKYPEFYLPALSYDETHLNKKGAEIYTTILAKNFSQLKEK